MENLLPYGPVLVAWAEAADRAASARAADGLLDALIRRVAPESDPRLGRRCPICGSSDHGPRRAVAAPVRVSVAHTAGLVVAAAVRSDAAAALGIDAEALSAAGGRAFPAPLGSLAEWVRYEAAVKADGRGLLVPPEEVVADGRGTIPPGTILPGAQRVRIGTRSFEVAEVDAVPGALIGIAVEPRS